MKAVELTQLVAPELQKGITEFETLFEYPLGDHQRFSIEHGPDFTAFFCAIGDAKTWIVQSGDTVIATVSSALRTVKINGTDCKIAYVGDLKVHPRYQALGSGKANKKMAKAVAHTEKSANPVGSNVVKYLRNLITQEAECAYCVVMDGTRITPNNYTGGRKLPKFEPVGSLNILRVATRGGPENASLVASEDMGFSLYKDLSAYAYCGLSDFKLRSSIERQWFVSGDRSCGMLEDTRRAKRLYLETGEELKSAHLSYFAFNDATAARKILDSSLESAHSQNFPAMFVSLSEAQYADLTPHLQGLNFTTSKATVYATAKKCALIPINTSEI